MFDVNQNETHREMATMASPRESSDCVFSFRLSLCEGAKNILDLRCFPYFSVENELYQERKRERERERETEGERERERYRERERERGLCTCF